MSKTLTRRRFLSVAAAGGAMSLMASCAPKVVKETVIIEKEVEKVVVETVLVKEEAPAASQSKVVIRYHSRAGSAVKPSGSEWPIHLDRLQEYMQENPNVEVQLEEIPTSQESDYWAKLFTMIASGTVGDFTWTSSSTEDHQRLAGMGALAALEEFVESEGIDLKEYFEAAIGGASFEGHLYGIPFTMHSGGSSILIYNKTHFEQAGVTLPGDDSTTDDLKEWSVSFTDKENKVYGFRPNVAGNQCHQTWLRTFGGYYISEDGKQNTMNSPEGVEWAKFSHALYQTDKVAPLEADLPSGGLNAMFAASKVIMFQNGPWAINSAFLAVGDAFEVGVSPFPKGPTGVRGYGGYVNSWAMFKQSKQQPEAFKVMHAMADYRAGVLRLDLREGLSAMPGVYNDPLFKDKSNAQIIYRTVQQCVPHRTTWNYRVREMSTVVNNEMDLVWLGKQEPTQQFMDNMVAKANEILAKERAK